MAHAPDDVSDTEDFFEMSLDNLCVAGVDGYFKRVNPSWTRTLGWSAEELLSRPSVEFVHLDDRASTLTGRNRLLTGFTLGTFTNRYAHKDGSYRWFEWQSIAHLDRGLVYAAARDVTEQKLAQELLARAAEREENLLRQLMLSDRLASVGTLAGGVGHQINNPLTAVTANITLIIEDLACAPRRHSDSELREMAVDVHDGAERIRKTVGGLMMFSRSDEERRGIMDLRPALELAIKMTSNEIPDHARIVKDFGDTPLIDADEARLAQVFINLLVNAAQALGEGSSDTNEIRITTTTDAGRAVVEVRDTGTGIPASTLGRIFDPFFTTKAVGAGTGLGLSICHTIITGMGGQISAASEPGRGTTFRVVLPAAPAGRGLAASVDPPQAGAAGLAILIVDDEPVIGRAIGCVLRKHVVTVVFAAKKALELLEAGAHFDVIFSDLMMPEMSGMELYDELVRRFPEFAPRMVFMSGGALTPRAKAFLDGVKNACIDKPFDPDALRALASSASTRG